MSKSIDRDTKLAYIQQITAGKMTATSVAKELGLHDSTVYSWLKKHREDPDNALPGSGKQKPEDADLRKLREENTRLKAEVEFLKKAAVYFAKDHGKSTR